MNALSSQPASSQVTIFASQVKYLLARSWRDSSTPGQLFVHVVPFSPGYGRNIHRMLLSRPIRPTHLIRPRIVLSERSCRELDKTFPPSQCSS